MKRVIAIIISLLASIAIVVLLPAVFHNGSFYHIFDQEETGMFEQQITSVSSTSHKVYKLYANGELVGILNNQNALQNHLDDVYTSRYAESFPNTECYLGEDVYLVDENTFNNYENINDQIFAYLDENDLYTLGCTEITFSEGEEVTGRMYVFNYEDYEEAMNEYVSYFVDQASVATYQNSSQISPLTTYGTQDIGVSVQQTITTDEAHARAEDIKTSKDEVLQYLKYGDNTELEYYTVTAYDTVAGVGARNYGLSATQVMNINRDKISSVDQVLEEGDTLCVTYFESPIDIVVYRRRLSRETIYFSTVYVEEETLLQGEQEVRTAGENGSRNTLYSEKWINGVLTSGTLESSVELQQATSEVVAVGTMALPGIGTGSLRYPVDNAGISCAWGCYYGHTGTDFVNRYDRWGDVIAADNGVVTVNSYNSINGYWVVIDHNTGYSTYYGHMLEPSHLEVGSVVSKGDVIGHIGMTGLATGPHVHFHIVDSDGAIRNACEGYMDCSGAY